MIIYFNGWPQSSSGIWISDNLHCTEIVIIVFSWTILSIPNSVEKTGSSMTFKYNSKKLTFNGPGQDEQTDRYELTEID